MKIVIHWSNGDKSKFILCPVKEKGAIDTLKKCLPQKEVMTTKIIVGKLSYEFNAQHIRMIETQDD